MPELPDVEMFKQYVDATALHHKISDVEVFQTRILDPISKPPLTHALKNKSFASTHRHGKHLFLRTDDESVLQMHFGMTGSLNYFKGQNEELNHVRLLFSFANGYTLAYISQRMLGKVSLEDGIDAYIEKNHLGPDALAVSLDDFKAAAGKAKQAVKSFLMDQKKLAGLGNVYSDEVLFQSRIHPKTSAKDLDEGQLKTLYKAIHKVCDYAVKHKADPQQFGKNYLLPRRSAKTECPRCGGAVKQVKVAGRTAYFCPNCQK